MSRIMMVLILNLGTILVVFILMAYSQKQQNSGFKFHQTGYKLINDRLDVEMYDKSWVSNTSILCYWFNRTARPINFTVALLKDLPNPKLSVQLFKFLSNEYRYFPLNFEFNFCSALEEDSFGFSEMHKCGNIYSGCNYKKGQTYRFCNWFLDSTKFPPYVPFGKYKLALALKSGSNTVALYNWYGKIEEIMKFKY